MVTAEIFGWLDRRIADISVGLRRRWYEVPRLDAPQVMPRPVVDWLHRFQAIPWAVAGLLLPVLMWPASWWFEVRAVDVKSAHFGEPVEMAVDRSINRSFAGKWSVTVRQWDGSGWVAWCNATGQSNYREGARFPVPLTLKWWTDGQCTPLPAGRYKLTTAWLIDTMLPDKTVVVDSNVFQIDQEFTTYA